MSGAETLVLISTRRAEMDCRGEVSGFSGLKESYVCAEIAEAIAGYCLWIFAFDRGWSADETIRNSEVDTEAMRKVVTRSGSKVKDAAVAAATSFKTSAQHPAGVKSRAVLARRSIGGRIWSLRLARIAKK